YGIEILFYAVVREWLDNHPAPIRRERLQHVRCRTHRVAHIVQAVEKGHQVVAFTGILLRSRDHEPNPVIHALLLRQLLRASDRRRVIVKAKERRAWIRLCEKTRRCAEAASHIRNACTRTQHFLNSVQRRDPFRDEVGRIARPEEALGAGKEIGMVVMPPDTLASPERIEQFFLRAGGGNRALEAARDEGRTRLISERKGLLFIKRILLGRSIVVGIAAGGLRSEPLSDVALGSICALCELA